MNGLTECNVLRMVLGVSSVAAFDEAAACVPDSQGKAERELDKNSSRSV